MNFEKSSSMKAKDVSAETGFGIKSSLQNAY